MWLSSLVAVIALVLSVALTGFVRRAALSRGLLDVPNQRSSHSIPTPRGGGLAIVVVTIGALLVFAALGQIDLRFVIALAGGGIAVAIVGLLDDRRGLSARTRLIVHLASALWALGWLGGLPPMLIGDRVIDLGWAGYAIGALGIVWTLNLFNFMDGIDGIAASEGTFVALGGTLLAVLVGASTAMLGIGLALSAACLGFLVWNWPAARIFMGDVGSGFLGFVIALLALGAARENPAAVPVWLILGGVFFVDATVTFFRRLMSGKRVFDAHRTHAYQWLARRWASHRHVTLLVIAIDLLWLLPCAYMATVRPALAGWLVLISLVPLVIGVVIAGAGRAEAGNADAA